MLAHAGKCGLTISEQCRLLRVSRSGFYRWQKITTTDAVIAEDCSKENDLLLTNAVLAAYSANPSFGYRKMGFYLRSIGMLDATEKRIRLLYQKIGLRGAMQSFKTTRPGKSRHGKFPYLLRNKAIMYANQVWATDITYIRLPQGMVFLTAVIDVFSRKILSWKLGERMSVDFCLDALYEAVKQYGVPAIFNTDCGSQYTSDDFIGALKGLGIEISMDGVGRCLDNIIVERTWKTLKYEFVFLHEWTSLSHLKDSLEEFIRNFNSSRPHEALDYRTPDEVYKDGCV